MWFLAFLSLLFCVQLHAKPLPSLFTSVGHKEGFHVEYYEHVGPLDYGEIRGMTTLDDLNTDKIVVGISTFVDSSKNIKYRLMHASDFTKAKNDPLGTNYDYLEISPEFSDDTMLFFFEDKITEPLYIVGICLAPNSEYCDFKFSVSDSSCDYDTQDTCTNDVTCGWCEDINGLDGSARCVKSTLDDDPYYNMQCSHFDVFDENDNGPGLLHYGIAGVVILGIVCLGVKMSSSSNSKKSKKNANTKLTKMHNTAHSNVQMPIVLLPQHAIQSKV